MSYEKGKGFGFGGFKMGGGGDKPPSFTPGYSLHMNVPAPRAGGYGHGTSLGRRRIRSEEDYFEEDDPPEDPTELAYIPAPNSPSAQGNKNESDSDDSVDPLDAFMAEVEVEVEKQTVKTKKEDKKKKENVRDDIEQEDVQEAFFRYMEENPNAGVILDDDDLPVEYDAEGNPILPEKNKIIDPLPPVDHSEIDYKKFVKNFYEEHAEISRMTAQEINALRLKLGIRVSGYNSPKPVSSFGHFGFDDKLIQAVIKAGYSSPTPIQAQGVPIAMSGRDVIGIAKTGSGKTAAFLLPMLIHIMDQSELEPGDGPIGLILAPTRELSQQIYHEAKKFGKEYNIKVVCAYGGGSMWEQTKACQEGAEIIVATPGRLIDLVKKKATNLRRVTYVVFDEADRMFDMGFEPQVRSIANHVRPDRQTLLFSATFKKKVERLARDILVDPIRVIQGDLGEANEDITQYVEVFQHGPEKWAWLNKRLVEFTSLGSVLIFVTRKANSEELAANLKQKDMKVVLIHGDMSQTERNDVIHSFKKKEVPIMVATDVAARGLDIPSIKTVVNYDVARDIDTHTHRIGRTGRAGEKGTAFTLVTPKDVEFAGHLVRNLESAGQYVPPALLDLAMKCQWFKNTRWKHNKAKKLNMGGGSGLGVKERPGLGSGKATSTQESSSVKGFSMYTPTRTSGPQSDRVSAMKAAFGAQFKSNFVSASADTQWKSSNTFSISKPVNNTESFKVPSSLPGSDPPKKKRKTRWDDA